MLGMGTEGWLHKQASEQSSMAFLYRRNRSVWLACTHLVLAKEIPFVKEYGHLENLLASFMFAHYRRLYICPPTPCIFHEF